MVVLPSPYAYAWFEAPEKQFNLEVKVGCKDPNSVDYCEDCQVEDNSRCGPCNAGWTKINDPNMKCWAVGSMTVDCSNGMIFYHPMGCVSAESTDYSGKKTDCSCGGKDEIVGCGEHISNKSRKWNKRGERVTSKYPVVKYKPAKGKPGYVKTYSGDYSWDRVLWGVTSDGAPVFLKGSNSWIKSTEEAGGLIKEKVYDIIKTNCGGTVTRVDLTEDDRKTIPPVLGVSTSVEGPSVTATAGTPASGLSNTSISTQSSVISPVTSGPAEEEPGSLAGLIWPIAGVIGLLGFMKLRGGKK